MTPQSLEVGAKLASPLLSEFMRQVLAAGVGANLVFALN